MNREHASEPGTSVAAASGYCWILSAHGRHRHEDYTACCCKGRRRDKKPQAGAQTETGELCQPLIEPHLK